MTARFCTVSRRLFGHYLDAECNKTIVDEFHLISLKLFYTTTHKNNIYVYMNIF